MEEACAGTSCTCCAAAWHLARRMLWVVAGKNCTLIYPRLAYQSQ